jgi:DNA polymerase-4
MFDKINPEKPMIMHIDLNSAFATIEQQAHPHLRGLPMGVTNRLSPECCVIAASYEAKALGIKVGTRRSDALAICPNFVILESDPSKYRAVYYKLVDIMQSYSPKTKMKSIDEGIIDFHGCEPILNGRTLEDIGYEIKQRVKDEIGDWMKINVGISLNWFLAKQAAGWHKPDGLDIIDQNNLEDYYKEMKLMDINGIAERNAARLMSKNIMSPIQFFHAPEQKLRKEVFQSVNGSYWYRRLRGYEVDDFESHKGSVGRSWVVHKPTYKDDYLLPCVSVLCESIGIKLRSKQLEARGIVVQARLKTGEIWRGKRMYKSTFYTNAEVYRRALEQFNQRPKGAIVTALDITTYELTTSSRSQLGLFEDRQKIDDLTSAVDNINEYYGLFTVYSATSLNGTKIVKQKVPFGGTEYFDLLMKRS